MQTDSNKSLVLGRHAILDLWGCSPKLLQDTAYLRELAVKAAELAKTTVLGSVEKSFEPQGFTIVLLLAESHLSLHTWPEHSFASVDLYSCNLETDFLAVCSYLESSLGAQRKNLSVLDRKIPDRMIDPSFSMFVHRNGGSPVENGLNFENITLKREILR